MAIESGRSTINLEQDIVDNGESYDFYQAVKVLNRLASQKKQENGNPVRISIQPELNLDYPESDIAEITYDDRDGYQVNTTFFGLYGVSSPLPGFYTEELLDDEWDELRSRKDLFDVVHNQIYPLLYQAWLKYKLAHNTVEFESKKYWEIIFDLAGLGDSYRQYPERYGFLARYVGLLSNRNKSLVGLKTLLSEYFKDIDVDVVPCVLRKVPIVKHQRCLIGMQNAGLGENSCIGQEIMERNGKFNIEVGPLNNEQIQKLKDNRQLLEDIKLLIKIYLVQPLAYGMTLLLEPGAAKPAALGMSGYSTLGSNCWLIDQPNKEIQKVDLIDE